MSDECVPHQNNILKINRARMLRQFKALIQLAKHGKWNSSTVIERIHL